MILYKLFVLLRWRWWAFWNDYCPYHFEKLSVALSWGGGDVFCEACDVANANRRIVTEHETVRWFSDRIRHW